MLATAAANPDRLVVGVDPVAAAMAKASRRAAQPPRKGGVSNALFVVASAEAPPSELRGIAGHVTVNLPWGSLLRGALALDPAAASGIAALLKDGGTADLLLAPNTRDRLAADVDVEARLAGGALAAEWRSHGLVLEAAREATPAELASLRTTWARRLQLGTTADRRAWRLVLRREGSSDGA